MGTMYKTYFKIKLILKQTEQLLYNNIIIGNC